MGPTLRIAASTLGLAASSVAASRGVPEWDASLFRTVNGLPDAAQYTAWIPMQLGALGAPLAIGTVMAVRGDARRGVTVAVAGTVTWITAKAVKRLVSRERPSADIEETRLRVGAADEGLGFPSGHAAVAVCVASALGGAPASAAIPLAVGIARVYVGAHYPLDVIGGWALGGVISPIVSVAVDAVWRS